MGGERRCLHGHAGRSFFLGAWTFCLRFWPRLARCSALNSDQAKACCRPFCSGWAKTEVALLSGACFAHAAHSAVTSVLLSGLRARCRTSTPCCHSPKPMQTRTDSQEALAATQLTSLRLWAVPEYRHTCSVLALGLQWNSSTRSVAPVAAEPASRNEPT